MLIRQVFVPERGLRAAAHGGGIRVERPGRTEWSDLPALSLGVGPGERLLALGPDAGLYQVAPRRSQRVLDGVDAFCSDALLLCAIQGGNRLLLEGVRAATSVALPAAPRGLAALGGGGELPHLCLLLFEEAVWLVSWHENAEPIHAAQLLSASAMDAAVLEGAPPLLAVRESPRLGATRLHLWSVRCDGDAVRIRAFPPLVADADVPTGLRSSASGPSALCGPDTWAVWREDRWSFQVGPAVGADFLKTRTYGNPASVEPVRPSFDKEGLPWINKLAVAPLARRA